jgi:cation diffusion facilitator family transporter
MPKRVGAATEKIASYQTHLDTMRHAYGQARWASWLSLWINTFLTIGKLIAGLAGNSLALVSDAINSLGDMITTSGVLLGMRISAWPATETHPYGYSRVEAVIGLYLAMALAGAGAWVGREGLLALGHRHDPPAGYTLLAALAVVAIKESLYHYKIRVARRLQSQSLRAAAWDHRSDAVAGLAVFTGLALDRWVGVHWGDGAATLVVAATIVWAGLSLMHDNVSELLDRQADVAFLQEIRRAALAVPGVAAIDKVFVRKAGLEYLADLHLEVDPHLNVEQAHDLGHQVQGAIQEALPYIHSILVHVEPHRAHSPDGNDKNV